MLLSVQEKDKVSLQDILHYSIFKTQEELLTELQAISPPWSKGKTGTRIIIWNLRRSVYNIHNFVRCLVALLCRGYSDLCLLPVLLTPAKVFSGDSSFLLQSKDIQFRLIWDLLTLGVNVCVFWPCDTPVTQFGSSSPRNPQRINGIDNGWIDGHQYSSPP